MEGGSFEPNNDYAFARAMEKMSSKSQTVFRWSVRLTGHNGYIGIASKLERKDDWIENYDENSILFSPFSFRPSIFKGLSQNLPSNITNPKSGDEIHFRFQPKLKKFSISFVRFIKIGEKKKWCVVLLYFTCEIT